MPKWVSQQNPQQPSHRAEKVISSLSSSWMTLCFAKYAMRFMVSTSIISHLWKPLISSTTSRPLSRASQTTNPLSHYADYIMDHFHRHCLELVGRQEKLNSLLLLSNIHTPWMAKGLFSFFFVQAQRESARMSVRIMMFLVLCIDETNEICRHFFDDNAMIMLFRDNQSFIL